MKKLKLTTKEAVDYLKKEVKIYDNSLDRKSVV